MLKDQHLLFYLTHQSQVKFSIPLIGILILIKIRILSNKALAHFQDRQLDFMYHTSPDILMKEYTTTYEVVLGREN